jgi:glycine dehydrogenase subunit 2
MKMENIKDEVNFKPKFEGKGLDFDVLLLCESDRGDLISGVDIEEIDESKFINMTGTAQRENIDIPSHSEPDIIRHFTRLSQKNYSIDTGFYPLGSCTMKHNPKINESVARLPGFRDVHPLQDEVTIQGCLEVMHILQEWLSELSGLAAVSLNPAAGAHGEYAGIRVIKKAHEYNGNPRKYVIIPDSAHGTNPATAASCGYNILTIKTTKEGFCDFNEIKNLVAKYGSDIAAIMLTNPNTCGKFEKDILKISDLIHSVGAYFYCDGANFNAIVGRIKPSELGIDVMHFNLHKTFSTPHGGGGPGCGPIAVSKSLEKFLPTPKIIKEGDNYSFIKESSLSIGQIKGFYGQFTLMVRALSYMLSNGINGLRQVSEDAVLSANYIMTNLQDYYHVAYPGYCMHECLFTDKYQLEYGITTLDIAKALIEYGFHPMTMYFPLTVNGAMLIEPTESENKDSLDRFINTMKYIAIEIKEGRGDKFKSFPLSTPRKRLDETSAARNPVITWKMINYS